jgi:hypothetical protein
MSCTLVPLRVVHVELRIAYIGRMYEKNDGGNITVPIDDPASVRTGQPFQPFQPFKDKYNCVLL